MKKKALLLSCLCIFGLCIGKTYAIDTKKAPIIETEKADPPHGYEEIRIKLQFLAGFTRDSPSGEWSLDMCLLSGGMNKLAVR